MSETVMMNEIKPEIYEIDFGVYDIDFEILTDSSSDLVQAKDTSDPLVDVKPVPEALLEVAPSPDVQDEPLDLEPDLSETEQVIVNFIRSQRRGRVHIGKVVRSCFGTERLARSQFSQLLGLLDGLKIKGYVTHEDGGEYYGAPDAPLKLCRCFECRVCTEVDLNDLDYANRVAACFAGKLATRAFEIIGNDVTSGIKSTYIAKDFEAELRIPREQANSLIRQLIASGNLFVASKQRGMLFVTSDASRAMGESTYETTKKQKNDAEVWSDDVIIVASFLLDELASYGESSQGNTVSQIAKRVSSLMNISETQAKRMFKQLEAQGIVKLYTVRQQEKPAGARKTITQKIHKVRFEDEEQKELWLSDRESVIKFLRNANKHTASKS